MKIFVTGATGFVGQRFLELTKGLGLTILALASRKQSERQLKYPHVVWVSKRLDEDLSHELSGCELVLHMAAHTANPPYATLEECIYWNVSVPTSIFSSASSVGVEKYINIGSCFEYRDHQCDATRGLDADDKLGPVATYPISKAMASVALEGVARLNDLKLCTLRLFQVYGDGELESRLYPSLVKAAKAGKDFSMSTGEQIRDFIHVDDVVKKILYLLEVMDDVEGGRPIVKHAATGVPESVLQFSKRLWSEYSAGGELLVGAKKHRSDQFMCVYSNKQSILQVGGGL